LALAAAQQPPTADRLVRSGARNGPMQNQDSNTQARNSLTAVTVFALVIGFSTLAGLAASQYVVSQKGREFSPRDIAIRRGEAVTIVNDDADLRHHVYVDAEKFNFDSGDQEPGSKTNITFPMVGAFEVLCAIHPKMKLIVHVK
jgi:plastocyanin